MAFDIRNTGFKLPSGWQFIRLGDIAKINGKTLTKKSALTDIRYIDISSTSTGKFEEPTLIKIEDAPSRAKRILTNNDIIISTVRPNLKQFAFIEEAGSNLIASTGFCVISADSEKLAWYLYALITSDIFTAHLVAVADGAAYPAFNPIEIEDAVIALPPENYLDVIVDVTRAIHKKIHLNTQTNQTLEQTAQALYKSWFVDFEPTRAKAAVLAAGGSQEEAETAAMSALSGQPPAALAALARQNPARHQQLATLAAAFPSALVSIDSYGEVPQGWEVKPLSEQFEFIGGAQPPKSEHIYEPKEGYERFIQNRDYANDNHKTYIPISRRNKRCDEKDILMDKYGEAGKVRFGIQGAYNVALAKILPKNDYCREFLRRYFMQEKIQAYLSKASVASTRNSLNSSTFAGMEIVIPSVELLKLFDKKCSVYIEKHLQLKREIRALVSLRDTLLPKLLNGELPADTSFQTASEAV